MKKAIVASLAITGLVFSGGVVEAGTTIAPLTSVPTSLGVYAMTPFGTDSNPSYSTSYLDVNSVSAPGGGSLTFDQALTHDIAGDLNTGWATWSQGYTGDVYDTIGSTDPYSVTLTLPGGTHAFYLFAEPAAFNTVGGYEISATADGTTLIQLINGNGGALGFGFYNGAGLTSITISSGVATDFAIGEFGISNTVPDTSTIFADVLLLLPMGMHGFRCLRNRKQNCAN